MERRGIRITSMSLVFLSYSFLFDIYFQHPSISDIGGKLVISEIAW